MAGDELLDVVDETGRHLGVADRATVHAQGLWHQVFHLLVVADRAGVPTAVLQRRARGKVTFPGLLDLSSTGHLAAGEAPVDGVRELHEELGVSVPPAALVPLGVHRIVDLTPEGTNRELAHVFLVHDDRPLLEYRPDPTEVDAVVDLPVVDGLDLLSGRRAELTVEMAAAGADRVDVLGITAASFVPEPPGEGEDGAPASTYWVTLLQLAARSAAGEARLAI